MTARKEWRFYLIGWVLFVFSAFFFIWSAVRGGDWIDIVASLLFLIACLFFIVPVWRLRPPRDEA